MRCGMGMKDKEFLVAMAKDTGVFKDRDLYVLEETIDDSFKEPPEYNIMGEKIGGMIAGFIIFGRTPITDSSWDMYWVVVDKNFQGCGVGKKLIKKAENFIMSISPNAVLRVETSTSKEYLLARKLYVKMGYREIGTIPNFYSQGDGISIYSKEMVRVPDTADGHGEVSIPEISPGSILRLSHQTHAA